MKNGRVLLTFLSGGRPKEGKPSGYPKASAGLSGAVRAVIATSRDGGREVQACQSQIGH